MRATGANSRRWLPPSAPARSSPRRRQAPTAGWRARWSRGRAGEGAEIEPLPGGGLRERFDDYETLLYLFGAGHVGRALVLALAPLPFRTRWIDPRREVFPERAPANVAMVHAEEPARELAAAPDGAQVLVMTHSHPLDLAIVSEALGQQRFSFVGLIGSATKRARFLSQMRAAGLSEEALARLVCPIGLPGVEGKEPAVIAAAIAAQLQRRLTTAESRSQWKKYVGIPFRVVGGERQRCRNDLAG